MDEHGLGLGGKVQPNGAAVSAELSRPNKKYVPFAEAHRFARGLHLRTRKEWRAYVKDGIGGVPGKPDNIPAHPDGIYKVKGWQGWKHWLGTADSNLG